MDTSNNTLVADEVKEKHHISFASILMRTTFAAIFLVACIYLGWLGYTRFIDVGESEEAALLVQRVRNAMTPAATGSGGDLPLISIHGTSYLGILEIPSMDIELAVQARWANKGYDNALGATQGWLEDERLAIEGRTATGQFLKLDTIAVDEAVYFTDMTGTKKAYRVFAIDTYDDAITTEEDDRAWDLAISAPDVFGTLRVSVKCMRDFTVERELAQHGKQDTAG
ncbi:MAG: hypothetical protein IJV62_00175 [Eggerthellaceae bacterium]|nr:hypothetical protein [Eggerthellaceae bacterium]